MKRISEDMKLDFKDVLIRPCKSRLKSRSEVNLVTEICLKNANINLNCIPLVASNMEAIGTFEMSKSLFKHKLLTCLHKHYSVEEWQNFAQFNPEAIDFSSVTCGISDEDFEKTARILDAVPSIKLLTVDVANGYQENFLDFLRRAKERWPSLALIAGNIVTPEMVEEISSVGADVVKVGLGPGSVCTTRIQTGVGYPQLSAVLECVEIAKDLSVKIMSDGGCTCPGDVAKALACGADFVMLGGLLSGHTECSGDIRQKEDGSLVKSFYGSASKTAMLQRDGTIPTYKCAEGKTVEVPFKGEVDGTILEILGGLRSTCTYTGAHSLSQLKERTSFIRVTQQVNQIYK